MEIGYYCKILDKLLEREKTNKIESTSKSFGVPIDYDISFGYAMIYIYTQTLHSHGVGTTGETIESPDKKKIIINNTFDALYPELLTRRIKYSIEILRFI